MCRIASNEHGFVGLDFKSHQKPNSCPYPAITQGNDEQDRHCDKARTLNTPEDILIPSGGPFVFMCKEGRMITGAPNKLVRELLRQKSFTELKTKTTQGKLSTMNGFIYRAT